MRFNVSEISALIKDRRTIYPEQFSNRVVHKELIEALLNNAIWAPTHGLTQPWRFIVISEDAKITLGEKLAESYLEAIPKENQSDAKLSKLLNRPKKASAVIALILHREKDTKISEKDDFAAVACAVQNMHLTATAYGLGAFWSTPKIMNHPNVRAFLELTEEQECVGFFYIGYPEIEWPTGQRRPIEYVTTWKK
jgi:nitroreductase